MAERPATCSVCGKRMSRKHWYYRNGNYFCKKSCWQTSQKKNSGEQAGGETKGEAKAAAS